MNEKQIQQLIFLQSQQAASLERIANLLEAFVKNAEQATSTSRYQYYKSLREYPGFDWSSIGATLVDTDENGATVIAYKNRQYKRRTGATKSKDIWFSCSAGKDEKGNNKYDNLIIFRGLDLEPEPLPKKIVSEIEAIIPAIKTTAPTIHSESEPLSKKIASEIKAVTPSVESTARTIHAVEADFSGKSITSFFSLEFRVPELKEWAISFMEVNWQKKNSAQLTAEEAEVLWLAIACYWAMNQGIYTDFTNGYRAVESSWMTTKAAGETNICNWAKQWKAKQLARL